jgi:hypothetical protein
MPTKNDLLEEREELRDQIQELKSQQQHNEIEAWIALPLPEPHYSQAIKQGIPAHFATNELKVTNLIISAGLTEAYNFVVNAVRSANPRGNLDFQLSMSRAIVGLCSYRLHFAEAKKIREQAVRAIPAWKRQQMQVT